LAVFLHFSDVEPADHHDEKPRENSSEKDHPPRGRLPSSKSGEKKTKINQIHMMKRSRSSSPARSKRETPGIIEKPASGISSEAVLNSQQISSSSASSKSPQPVVLKLGSKKPQMDSSGDSQINSKWSGQEIPPQTLRTHRSTPEVPSLEDS
jgi:hypothetical protein